MLSTTTVPEAVQTTMSFVPLQLTGDFLWLAVVFFVLALIAWAVGARGMAGMSMSIARIFIVVFVILAVVSLLL